MKKELPCIGIVVPCYNEGEIIAETTRVLYSVLDDLRSEGLIQPNSFVALIDDGSTDRTWPEIKTQKERYASLRGLKLSRNFGHQHALLAGLSSFAAQADCLISIDADLQDDVRVIRDMLDQFLAGAEIVYGVRRKRPSDTLLKRSTALGFYRCMQMLGVNIIFNHADYRLCSRRVLEELQSYREVNLFLRGIFPTLGFRTACVYYDRLERQIGTTKYPLRKMLSFAWEGISSFSVKPLRLIGAMGFTILCACMLMGCYAIYSYFALSAVPGWTSTVLPLYLLAGVQLFSIGLIGEYLGKVYQEVKRRPRFIVERRLD